MGEGREEAPGLQEGWRFCKVERWVRRWSMMEEDQVGQLASNLLLAGSQETRQQMGRRLTL